MPRWFEILYEYKGARQVRLGPTTYNRANFSYPMAGNRR